MPLYSGNAPQLKRREKIGLTIDDFGGGKNSLFSQTRVKKNQAVEATNIMLIEDGVWDKRWGTGTYPSGVTFTARPDGAVEYRKSDGTRQLIVVADSNVYQITESGTKVEISGGTNTQGNRAYFLQINSFLYIANGVDDLMRYDGSSITTYTALATPAWDVTPLARGAGLSAGNNNLYYRVTASNNVGETLAAAEQTITADIPRDDWDEADEYIDIGWANVTGATKYTVYYSDTSGFEVKLAETTESFYRDDGTADPNPYIEVPTDNTTAAPLFGPMCLSGNRIWATLDPNNPWRVYFTGTGVNLGNFSPAYGGGWIDLEKGGRATCTTIRDYQGKPHVMLMTANGRGQVWQVSLDSVTIGSTDVIVPVPTKIVGSIGCDAPRGMVEVENDFLFFNRKGVFVLGNEPGVLGVLRTNELTVNIRPDIQSLDGGSLDKVAAYYFESKVFFAVPSSSGEPDQIFVFDRERNVWYNPWTIGVSEFLEYTDTSGTIHLLGITADRLVEFNPNFQGDDGVAFSWRYTTPRVPADKDWSKYQTLKRAKVRLRNAQGTIDVSVSGTGKNKAFSTLASESIETGSSGSGIGWDQIGSFLIGSTLGVPITFAEQSLLRYVRITKKVRDAQMIISGDGLADRAVILGIQFQGMGSFLSAPLSEKL